MRFSLIYSVDVPEGIRISDFAPKDVTSLGEETEDDSQYEYGYLEGRWTTGQHRKWSALHDRRQFEEFVVPRWGQPWQQELPDTCHSIATIDLVSVGR